MNAVIFDFDGTIADSFEQVLDFLLRQAGRDPLALTTEERAALKELSMKDLALRIGIPAWKLPLVYIRGKQRLKRRMHQVPLFWGMETVLKTLHDEQYQLFIISSNSRRNISRFMVQHGLGGYFTHIYGSAGWLGKGPALKKALQQNHLEAAKTVYVGDEVRDVIGAHLAGMPSIGVTWGFSSHGELQKYNPTIIARTPGELQKALVEWGRSS